MTKLVVFPIRGRRWADGWRRQAARGVGGLSAILFLSTLFCSKLAAETLTIATYNVENYVATNRVVEGVYHENYPKPELSKQALRAIIRELKADVLALQEMGPRGYLEELRRDLAREGVDYPYAELLDGSDTDRHVAVLSKVPFTEVYSQTDLSFKYFGSREKVKRGVLEVRFGNVSGGLALFIVHLKSRITERDDDPESALRRAGEATAVRDYVLNRFPDPSIARFLILGDFNDGRTSKPLRLLTQRGKTEIARPLTAVDSRGETWTHWYRKGDTYSKIDHILISEGLRSTLGGTTARIYDNPDWNKASDHRPVVVTLVTKK